MKIADMFCFLILIIFFQINCLSKSNNLNRGSMPMEKKDVYIINNNEVNKEEFDKFLKTLKEIENTWYCAELKDGGETGYDAADPNGIVYQVRFRSSMNGSRNSIIKKLTL